MAQAPCQAPCLFGVEEVEFLVKIEMEEETETAKFKGDKEVNRKE